MKKIVHLVVIELVSFVEPHALIESYVSHYHYNFMGKHQRVYSQNYHTFDVFCELDLAFTYHKSNYNIPHHSMDNS